MPFWTRAGVGVQLRVIANESEPNPSPPIDGRRRSQTSAASARGCPPSPTLLAPDRGPSRSAFPKGGRLELNRSLWVISYTYRRLRASLHAQLSVELSGQRHISDHNRPRRPRGSMRLAYRLAHEDGLRPFQSDGLTTRARGRSPTRVTRPRWTQDRCSIEVRCLGLPQLVQGKLVRRRSAERCPDRSASPHGDGVEG